MNSHEHTWIISSFIIFIFIYAQHQGSEKCSYILIASWRKNWVSYIFWQLQPPVCRWLKIKLFLKFFYFYFLLQNIPRRSKIIFEIFYFTSIRKTYPTSDFRAPFVSLIWQFVIYLRLRTFRVDICIITRQHDMWFPEHTKLFDLFF